MANELTRAVLQSSESGRISASNDVDGSSQYKDTAIHIGCMPRRDGPNFEGPYGWRFEKKQSFHLPYPPYSTPCIAAPGAGGPFPYPDPVAPWFASGGSDIPPPLGWDPCT